MTAAQVFTVAAKARTLGWSWLASQMTDGLIFADLRDLVVPRVKDTIGRYEPASGLLPLVGNAVPEDWERVLTPGATVFHLMRENPDGGLSVPQWSGFITEQPLTEGDSADFPMATIPAYFDRRYVGDETYTQVGQNLIVQDLVEKYAATGANGGIPIRVEIVNGGDGTLRDREYKDQDDKTLYSVLTELMEVEGGPEWTVAPERLHDPERIGFVLYVGDRVGSPVTPGLNPAAVFEMPGAVRQFKRTWSYQSGRGANVVMAVSSGQGDSRPQSAPVVTADPIRPTFEYRFTPSTSIKNTETLDEHARQRASLMADGAISLSLDAVANAAPIPNHDWALGDDIGFKIGDTRTTTTGGFTFDADGYADGAFIIDSEGYALPLTATVFDAEGYLEPPPTVTTVRPSVPAFPRGLRGVARAIGVEFEFGSVPTVVPILAGDDVRG